MNRTTTHARWRVLPVHLVAKLFGVLIKVEGMPFGSNRTRLANSPRREDVAGGQVGGQFTVGGSGSQLANRDRDALVVLLTQVIANSSAHFVVGPSDAAEAAALAFRAGLSAFEANLQPVAPEPPQRPLGVDGLAGCQEARHSPVCASSGGTAECGCRSATAA
ncbi:hypothetical protein [Janthinobacterium sp. MP5059B]|uniref:hypothetical protein n=1 Tax=Janthinobacterium sp. MP5059B TaxID=1766683 RepID=UPI00087465D0|nr:hypothetical protein [Janthinobacterium sp. MP5059B]